jgi:ATP-binding cassette subfamily F protein 3
MSLVQCIDLGIEFAGEYVLRGVNCTIEHNSKIGLIGPNGSGKSTLIKMILGDLRPSLGRVQTAKKLNIAYLAQNATINPNLSLMQYIESAREDISHLKHQMAALSSKLEEKHDLTTQEELNSVIEKMHQCSAFEHENEIKHVLLSLGFPEEQWHKLIGDFSGGEQTRICLAYLLLRQYDLLILDEPTNHLDLLMIRWLENYLRDNPRPYLVVSHDREFLDRITTSIYYISGGKISISKGNYSSFYEARQIALLSQQRQYERQQKQIKETQAFIQKNIAGQKTNQAKSRLKGLERMELVEAPQTDTGITLKLHSATRSGNDVFRLDGVSFGIGSDLILAEDVRLRAHWQDRIAIIGPNGCGKSTLLKILLNRHPIISGELYLGASLKIAYYDQHQNTLDDSLTVMQTLWQLVPSEPQGYVLSWLARFGFKGDDVNKKVSVLSGGEKSRLYLSVLIHEKPNLLMLDEPTNHLDIPMHDALLEALKSFDGSIIFVSHDRHFIRELADSYWVFCSKNSGGKISRTITQTDVGIDEAIEMAFSEPEIIKSKAPERQKKRKVNPWHLDQIHNKIEEQGEYKQAVESRISQIHEMLADSATYNDSSKVKALNDEAARLQSKICEINLQIEQLENKYLELACED